MASMCKAVAASALYVAVGMQSDALSLVQLNVKQLEAASMNATSASTGGSLPPLLDDFPALKDCSAGQLAEWKGRSDSTAALLDAWTQSSKGGAIVKDNGEDSCVVAGDASSKKVMTLVKEPEKEVCKISPQGRKAEEAQFTVSGKMAELKATRKYQIMWPADGTCSKSTPCSVMMFFHGCASMVLPAMQASADDQCFSDLNTVMVMPKLEKGEKWTEHGTAALDEFVMPLWDSLKDKYGEILDTKRVAAVGASLGSGMALQASLLHPDVFSLAVAAGLADGSHCEDGEGGKVEWDSSALLAGNSVPQGSWKLKGVVVVMSERETELNNRLSSLLNIMDDNGVFTKASLNMRLYADAGHATGILYTFNQWAGMHKTLFNGLF